MRGALLAFVVVAAGCGGSHPAAPDLAATDDLAGSDLAPYKALASCPQTLADYCAANPCPADLKAAEACSDSSRVDEQSCLAFTDVSTSRYGWFRGTLIDFLFDPSSGALRAVMGAPGCVDCGTSQLDCIAGPGQLTFYGSSCTTFATLCP